MPTYNLVINQCATVVHYIDVSVNCDDAHVTSVTSKAVLAEKAYILFYVRQIAKDELKGSEIHKNGSVAAPKQ